MGKTFDLGFLLKLLLKARGLLSIDTSHDGLRKWLKQLLSVFDFLAEQTAFEIDDGVIDFLSKVIADDEAYDALYAIVEKALDKFNPDEESSNTDDAVTPVEPILQEFVKSQMAAVDEMMIHCTKPMTASIGIMDWVNVIVQIIQMILSILQSKE